MLLPRCRRDEAHNWRSLVFCWMNEDPLSLACTSRWWQGRASDKQSRALAPILALRNTPFSLRWGEECKVLVYGWAWTTTLCWGKCIELQKGCVSWALHRDKLWLKMSSKPCLHACLQVRTENCLLWVQRWPVCYGFPGEKYATQYCANHGDWWWWHYSGC